MNYVTVISDPSSHQKIRLLLVTLRYCATLKSFLMTHADSLHFKQVTKILLHICLSNSRRLRSKFILIEKSISQTATAKDAGLDLYACQNNHRTSFFSI